MKRIELIEKYHNEICNNCINSAKKTTYCGISCEEAENNFAQINNIKLEE